MDPTCGWKQGRGEIIFACILWRLQKGKIIWVKAEPNKNLHKKRYVEKSRKCVTDQKTDRQTCTKIYTSTDRHTETHTDTRIQRQIERKRDRKRNMLRNGDGKTKMLSRSSDKIRLSMFRQSLSVIILLFKVYHGKKQLTI